ncbi:hypothetical protein L1987_45596 [Smallanthus sonchifolius]|uniref:Uncharacterized protein n=1 Tax=Smallanthus sonchifolius TaxID=185202 RepID=A0ACB9FYH1_9ASTR|nr:hypothetical protein L1987_45596 [Smallanthus sonchifolius]
MAYPGLSLATLCFNHLHLIPSTSVPRQTFCTMDLDYKHPHNVLPYLRKHSDYSEFHPIIDFLQRWGKYSFPDSDVEKSFRDMGYGGNPKVTIKKNQLDFHWRAPQQELVKPNRRSKSVRFPLPNIGSTQASQSHQSGSRHLVVKSKRKKHIINAPSKKAASLGKGDSPNPIGKKLPTKPTRNIFKDALKRKVEALYRQVSKRVRFESEQNPVRQHQASLETEISKPVPIYAESTFTVVATETPSVATELSKEEADEKRKGKMPVTEEEDEKTCSVIPEHVPTDPHSIILETNMPLGMDDEIAQRIQEEENEAAKKEESERKLEVYKSKGAARRQAQKKIS